MNLLNLFCRGQEFKQRLEQSRTRLYRLAYAWCHDAALSDDLVQETLEKALKKKDQLRDPAALETWLFSILTNCWRDHFRRSRDMVDIDDVPLEHPVTPELEHQQHQIVREVRAAIARLPLGQRQVLTLVDLEECSYIEVAHILDVPVGTVMSRLCRARRALKEALLDSNLVPQESATPMQRMRRIK
ncbi:MAG: RNA polymerase sigma factor [Gammaproteobacteria bacterium]|nr:RNA polymerase sigma factor [Gammaproteobacteria bacterium]